MENKRNLDEEKIMKSAIVVLGIIVIFLFYYVYLMPNSTSPKQYSVEIIEITGGCEDCFDVEFLTDELISQNNLKVNSRETLDYGSAEAVALIDKYAISSIPSVIVISKDIEKIGIDEQVFSINKNYALFDKSVPYIDLDTNEVRGLVEIKEIQPGNCLECKPLLNMKTQFEGVGIKIKDYLIIDSSSEQGRSLIEENELNFVPVLLISKDIEDYWWIFSQIENSFIEKQDYYVFKNPTPPYIDLEEGKIKGKVDIIHINNKSCEECFDTDQLRESFQNLGIYINNERHVDVSSGEGKNLLNQYNITAIPTIILSKEIQDYISIKQILEQTGSIEGDGKFVFRKIKELNVKYQEL